MILRCLLLLFLPTLCWTACTLSPGEAVPTSASLLSGLNTVLGPIINLSYTDAALERAIDGLGVASLRHPGGTVADYWSLVNGSFVGEDGTTAGCSNGTLWDFCAYAHRGDHAPDTFTARSFSDGVGAGKQVVWDLNVFTLSTKDALSQLDYMKANNLQVHLIELGNEFYLKDFDWRFPDANAYWTRARPVAQHARKLFPKAQIAVVGKSTSGAWNAALAAVQDEGLYDAVTVHEYQPDNTTIAKLPVAQQVGAIAGFGELTTSKIAAEIRKDWPKGLPVWRTEFNFPTWGSGPPLPSLLDGALHGLFWASHVLAAVQRVQWLVPVPVVMLHALGVQEGVGWDSQAGIVRLPNAPNQPQAVEANGVAQIFSHLSQVGLSATHMHGANAENCPAFPITLLGTQLPCLLAAFFTDTNLGHNATVILNRCDEPVQLELDSASMTGSRTAIAYSAKDAGGWAPLPSNVHTLPWPTPLSATTHKITDVTAPIQVPAVSLLFLQ